MDEIPNDALQLIIIASVANHTIFGLLLEYGSSCNILYIDTLVKLGLLQHDLDPYDDRSLLAFNGSTTRPYGEANMLLSLGK